MEQDQTQNTEANDTGGGDLAGLEADLQNLESASGGEQQQTQDGKLTPEEHAERSKLGRKVADLNEKFDRILTLLEGNQRQREAPPAPPLPPSVMQRQGNKEDDLPDIVATPDDVVKVLEKREKERTRIQKMYEQDYVWQVEQERGTNPDIHEQVVQEMLSNPDFNRRHTGHPIVDAQKNYALALKAVIRKEAAKGRAVDGPNLKHDDAGAVGVSSQQTQGKSKVAPQKLSPEAEYYLRKTGRSDEWAAKALGSDLPITISGHLRG